MSAISCSAKPRFVSSLGAFTDVRLSAVDEHCACFVGGIKINYAMSSLREICWEKQTEPEKFGTNRDIFASETEIRHFFWNSRKLLADFDVSALSSSTAP
jgi:hypothetical protein